MTREAAPNPEQPDVDPVLELVALHFEKEAMGWLTKPEEYHPLKGAIDSGVFGTRNQRISAVTADAKGVADWLMGFAATVRTGAATESALAKLRRSARFDKDAFNLMKALDANAEPWYPDADANGVPVVAGKRYRYEPGTDNQGNEPGYYNEGEITKVEGMMAFAIWEKVGEENPLFWSRQKRREELEQEDYVREIMFEIEDEVNPRETCVPTTMLSPVDENEV